MADQFNDGEKLMRKHMMKFDRVVFAALAVVTTTTIGILLHATFSMAIVA